MLKTIYKSDVVIFKQDTINHIIFINCIKDSFTEKEYEEYHEALLQVYSNYEKINTKFFFIFDINKLGMYSLTFSKAEANFFNKLEPRTEKIVHAMCTITESTIIKNSINFFIGLFSSVVPIKIVSDIEEAINFINSLKKNNVKYNV